MKRFNRIAAGVVFALAAALGPRGAAARDVTIELMNAQGQPSGHATIAPESAGVRLRVDVTGLAPGSHGIHFHQTTGQILTGASPLLAMEYQIVVAIHVWRQVPAN